MKKKKELITFYDLCSFLKNADSPLGDLCYDALRDCNFDWNEPFIYLKNMRAQHGDYLTKPIQDIQNIYNIINNINI